MFAAAVGDVNFEDETNLARYTSSAWAQRGFCKLCGSHLFYFLKPVGQYLMSVGTFDDPVAFTLAREIYTDHKPAGYGFSGDLPQLTEADVLARFASA